MPAPTNAQVGVPLVSRRPPQLEGHVVVGGTWKPKNTLKNAQAFNEDEVLFNVSFYGPGEEVECELYQLETTPPAADLSPSQVIDEVATEDNPDPGSWLVMKADPIQFGAQAVRFAVTLMRSDSLDLSQTS